MIKMLVPVSRYRFEARSRIRSGSTPGWASKSKSSMVAAVGRFENLIRRSSRRASVACTSIRSSLSSVAVGLRFSVFAVSSTAGRASAAVASLR